MKLFLKAIMHNDVTGCVILISYKIEYLKSKTVTTILLRKLYYDLTDLSNAIKNLCEKISFYKHFNDNDNVQLPIYIALYH